LYFFDEFIVAFEPWLVKPWLLWRFLARLMALERVMSRKTLEEVRQDLALNLKALRAEKGVAQERLALDAGVDRTVVSKIERAKTNPSLDVLLRLANQLDSSLSQLLESQKQP
jgi:DNA-binding XRE family transcriptional regulator